MCGCFCIEFVDFMLKGKSFLEYTNLFSPNEYKENDKIILKYFQQNLKKLKCIAMLAINTENLNDLKYHIFLKTLRLTIVYSKCGHEYKTYLNKKNQLKY